MMDTSKGMLEIQGQTIMITGGGGFIGSSLAERLINGNEIILFDNNFDGPVKYTDLDKRKNVRFFEGDILSQDDLSRAISGVDTIIHAAAIVGVSKVLSQPRQTIEVNFTGAANLLRSSQNLKGIHRFLYFSTSEVFGGSSFRVDEQHHSSIGTVGEARWSYSISKLAGEHLCYAYYQEFNLPIVIVRPFNVFGPRRTGNHAILQFVMRALRNEPLEVHGDGTQIRAWCYIDDFLDAVVAMLSIPEAVGNDFNIGAPLNTLSIYELAKRIIRLTDSNSPIVFRKVEFIDIDIRVPRTTKAFDILNFTAGIEIDQALESTIEWYRQHLSDFDNY